MITKEAMKIVQDEYTDIDNGCFRIGKNGIFLADAIKSLLNYVDTLQETVIDKDVELHHLNGLITEQNGDIARYMRTIVKYEPDFDDGAMGNQSW